jgi:hypothetical protein
LLAGETASEARTRAPEVGPKREHAAVNARLHFTLEERFSAELRPTQFPAPRLVIPPQARFKASRRRLDGRFGAVDAGRAQEQQREKGRQPEGRIGPAPRAVRSLHRENCGAKPLSRDAGALRGDRGRPGIRQITHRLPAQGGVRIK